MVNKVTLIGRLGKDPEVRTLESGTQVAKFSLATDESYKDKNGEWQTNTEWHTIIVWREGAERAAKQLKKGYLVYVEGKVTYRTWKDEHNVERITCEIQASSFRLLKEYQPATTATNTTDYKEQNIITTNFAKEPVTSESDDLPF